MKNRLLIIFDGYTSPFQGVTVPALEQRQSVPFILDRVRKDYAPWDIEVTDKDDGSNRPTAIVAVGGGSATQGGSSFVGGFLHQGTLNDGFVYSAALQNNPKWIADAISHEAGHLVGLQHQAQWTNGVMTDKYRRDGAIMGSPYFIDNPFWTIGQTPTGTTQDDVAILTAVLGAAQAPLPAPKPTMLPNDCQIAITAPLTVQAGAAFLATFTIKNTGSNNWRPRDKATFAGYALGTPRDSLLWGNNRLDLSAPAASGESVTLNASFKAPTTPGDYPFAWDMVQELVVWFGKTVSQTIRIISPSSGAIPVSINNVPGIWTPNPA